MKHVLTFELVDEGPDTDVYSVNDGQDYVEVEHAASLIRIAYAWAYNLEEE